MQNKFKPMLACTFDAEKAVFPYLASPKLDGVRCIVRNGTILTRALKPIPNKYVNDKLSTLPDFDGELIVGGRMDGNTFARTTSGIMRQEGIPDFTYHVFDSLYDLSAPFSKRGGHLDALHESGQLPSFVSLVPQYRISNAKELAEYLTLQLSLGYEGVMLRSPTGGYKFGRSTLKEGGLLKLKPFCDAEAAVVSCIERMHNNNPIKENELGRSSRSSHSSGMTPAGDLGSFQCVMVKEGRRFEFNIGSGFSASDRVTFWSLRGSMIGRKVKFKYQDLGSLAAPRFPIFLGFRAEEDMP